MSRSKQLTIIWVFAVSALCAAVCVFMYSAAANRLESQQAARRWAGESGNRMAQISCFFPAGSEITESDVYSFREAIKAKMLELSIEAPETGRLFADAWSAKAEVFIESERGSAVIPVIGTGGDFFLFHPLRLRNGAYITGEDIMRDRVVADEEAAWRFYGALDVAGFPLTVGGGPFIVAGVAQRESDPYSRKAYSDGASMFVPYESLGSGTEIGISCYEFVMPNPISGLAFRLAEERFGVTAEIRENSERFRTGNILSVLTGFSDRVMRADARAYPYWENAARLAENKAALLLIAAVLCSLFPAVCTVIALRFILKRSGRRIRAAVIVYMNSREERRLKRYTDKRRDGHGEHYAEKYNEDI